MSNSFSFREQLVMSRGIGGSKSVQEILVGCFPGAIKITDVTEREDRNGTDYWIDYEGGKRVGVDLKARDVDFKAHYGKDDLALEVWSDYERQKVGWSRDPAKHTDYILFFWRDTGRWMLVAFRHLCAVYIEHCESWSKLYKTQWQWSPKSRKESVYLCPICKFTHWEIKGWHSQWNCVPRQVLWTAIQRRFGGDE